MFVEIFGLFGLILFRKISACVFCVYMCVFFLTEGPIPEIDTGITQFMLKR